MSGVQRMLMIAAACIGGVACASSSGGTSAAPQPSAPSGPTPIARARVAVAESFSPSTGAAALKAFVPDVPASEVGGECALHKLSPASKATIATAYFPTHAESKMNVSITFDSAGRVARYSEVRGMTGLRGAPPRASDAQRDSLLRAALAATRTTSISLDYSIEQAILRNHGGGQPDHAVLVTPREVESLPVLGPIKDRLVLVRKLCGV